MRDVAETLDDDATAARSMLVEFTRADAGTCRTVNTPWKFDGRAPGLRLPPPRLGEHDLVEHGR